MKSPVEKETVERTEFPHGKVRARLEQFTDLRAIGAEVEAPKGAATIASATSEFAAGITATGARLGEIELPGETDADGAGTLDASVAVAAGVLPPETQLGVEVIEADLDDVGIDEASEVDLPDEAEADSAAHLLEVSTPRWRSLGPSYMSNGQTYGSGGNDRVDVAGRVSTIAIDPGNRNHILVGAAGGGIWESTNRGQTWAPRSDSMPSLAIGAIAFDPSNHAIAYAGTGEGDFYASLGAGLLRSTNGGRSWSVRATVPFVGTGFYDLSIDPGDGSRILAATRNGTYESTDAGVSWTRRRSSWSWTISRGTGESLAATSGGLVRSTNGGTSWAAVNLPGQPATWIRMAVRHAPSDHRIAYVFACGRNGTAYLWRRSTAGNWQSIGTPSGLSVNQAWYDWFLGISPDDTNQVFLGAINVWRGTFARRRWRWSNIAARSTGDSIHPDQHTIAFDPVDPRIVYVGNDGGVYRSPNRGGNWQALNRGLYITEIEYLAQDLGNCRFLFGGTQDNGSIRFTGNRVWEHAADGDGGDCGIVDTDPNVVFHSFNGMGMVRSATGGGWESWQWRGPNVPRGYSSLFYPPLDVSGSTVAQAGETIYVSRNRAGTFTQLNLPGSGRATAMHAVTPDLILVGMEDGRVARVRWMGTSWNVTELTRPRAGAAVADIHTRPGNGDLIWVSYRALGGGRAYLSGDGGTTWADRTTNLPPVAINAIAIDPGNGNRVWVGGDVGVYETRNSGRSWRVLARGIPNAMIGDLVFHPSARLLRAGTRNRGVWEIDVDGALTSPIVGVQWTGSLAPGQSRRWFTFNWPSTWHVLWTVMPVTPRRGAPQLSWNVEVERGDSQRTTYWITVRNLTDTPVVFEGRYAILSRC